MTSIHILWVFLVNRPDDATATYWLYVQRILKPTKKFVFFFRPVLNLSTPIISEPNAACAVP